MLCMNFIKMNREEEINTNKIIAVKDPTFPEKHEIASGFLSAIVY